MTFQKRLLRIMKRNGWRVADLARAIDKPYTTVREWVENGRVPVAGTAWARKIAVDVAYLEEWS
jgi:hypothetical protein